MTARFLAPAEIAEDIGVSLTSRRGQVVTRPDRVVYFARCKGIAKMGPYATDLDAWRALRGLDGLPVPDATVWSESPVVAGRRATSVKS